MFGRSKPATKQRACCSRGGRGCHRGFAGRRWRSGQSSVRRGRSGATAQAGHTQGGSRVPLGDAVGFVDGKQRHRQSLQAVEEALGEKSFRGDRRAGRARRRAGGPAPTAPSLPQRGVVAGGAYAVGDQGVDLVLISEISGETTIATPSRSAPVSGSRATCRRRSASARRRRARRSGWR